MRSKLFLTVLCYAMLSPWDSPALAQMYPISGGSATGLACTNCVSATELQGAAADLGGADVTVNLSNTNGAFNTNVTVDGTVTAGAFAGNASTATALAADPPDCDAATYAQSIAASGALTCDAIDLGTDTAGNYASSASEGGAADGLACTACVNASELQAAAADLGAADVTVNLGNSNAGGFNTNVSTDGTFAAGGAMTGASYTCTTGTDCHVSATTTAAGEGNCASIAAADAVGAGPSGGGWVDLLVGRATGGGNDGGASAIWRTDTDLADGTTEPSPKFTWDLDYDPAGAGDDTSVSTAAWTTTTNTGVRTWGLDINDDGTRDVLFSLATQTFPAGTIATAGLAADDGITAGMIANVTKYIVLKSQFMESNVTDGTFLTSAAETAGVTPVLVANVTDLDPGAGVVYAPGIEWDDDNDGAGADTADEDDVASGFRIPGDYGSGGSYDLVIMKDAHAGVAEVVTCNTWINGAIGTPGTATITGAATSTYTVTPVETYAAGDFVVVFCQMGDGDAGTDADDVVTLINGVFVYTAGQ